MAEQFNQTDDQSAIAHRAGQGANPHDIRHVIVLGNPDPASFCHAMAETCREAVRDCGQEAVVRDLYALQFDPLLKATERPGAAGHALAPDTIAELAILRDAAVISFVYPLWFGMPPAIIKGYVDRVLGAGFSARDITSGAPHDLLAGKRLCSFSSSASTRPWLEEHGQWLSLRQGIDAYFSTIFSMVDGGHVHFDAIVPNLSTRYARECLARVRDRTRLVCAAELQARHARQSRACRQPG